MVRPLWLVYGYYHTLIEQTALVSDSDCTVLTRAPSAVASVILASQVTKWEGAKELGFAPTANPTPVMPMPSVSWRETAALAAW